MKLPNGYGSVIKLGGKQVKKYIGYYKTRQEAMKALADYNENPFDLATKKITFAEVFERWQKVKYKDADLPAEYSAAYKKLAPLYNIHFADIRKRHIQAVIDNLKVGYSSKITLKRFAQCCSNMPLIWK